MTGTESFTRYRPINGRGVGGGLKNAAPKFALPFFLTAVGIGIFTGLSIGAVGQLVYIPAAGSLSWDGDFKRVSAAKISPDQFNLDRASGILSIPTRKDPAADLAALEKGAIVGGLYLPVRFFGTRFILEPGFYEVRVAKRDGRWIAELSSVSGRKLVVPAEVGPAPKPVEMPLALVAVRSIACYIFDNLMVCI